MIYLRLDGRIGNQLFMYAFAKKISCRINNEKIIIDDSEVRKRKYINSLPDYKLNNVEFIHDHRLLNKDLLIQKYIFFFYRVIRKFLSFSQRYNLEIRLQKFFNKFGLILCENGYINYDIPKTKNVFVNGYFQSSLYFDDIKDIILNELDLSNNIPHSIYSNLELLRNNNSICVSIKVQHNVGNSMYDVCNDGYWIKALNYLCHKVENPLLFICSDNIDYVKKNLIDCSKYRVIFQDQNQPVNISLYMMSECRHFIIGNTTFGWWAQYLCKHKNKIVVAPSKWMRIEMPIDIYQDGWYLIEV